MKKRSLVWFAAAALGCVAAAGILIATRRLSPTPAPSGPVAMPTDVMGPAEALDFTPSIEDGSITLKAAYNANEIQKAYEIRLTPKQQAYLDAHKFLLLPVTSSTLSSTMNYDEMLMIFDLLGGGGIESRSPSNARLVTPDVVLHAFHRYFSLTLEELEKNELQTLLNTWLTTLLKASAKVPKSSERVRAHLAVALTLLETQGPRTAMFESPDQEAAYLETDKTADTFAQAQATFARLTPGLSEELRNRAIDELKRIYQAKDMSPSPLFGSDDPNSKADYSQFTPRSHYAKSSALRAYFRTMMFLGRQGYVLKSPAGMADAVVLSGLMSRHQEGWQRIMEITSLYAGASDDLTLVEWKAFLNTCSGQEAPEPTPALLEKLRSNIGQLRIPRILSTASAHGDDGRTLDAGLLESLSFRVFGQRFTYDAWVINQMTNGGHPPTALYVPSTFGSPRARAHVQTFVMPNAKEPNQVMSELDRLSGTLAGLSPKTWETSMDGSWLHVLASQTRTYGKGYPAYMQAEPFQDKQLMTYLGSYTELKHDTLLYAKQSYAEFGEGGDEQIPPVVKGFVEPNLDFWSRMCALTARTQAFFDSRKLFQQHIALERLREFSKDLDFLRTLATQELKGEAISDDDYEALRNIKLAYMSAPMSGIEDVTEDTGKTALVADVHTDAFRQQVLYEATGRPLLMLALVGNEKSPRLTVGLAFSHHEFEEPLARRLTDETWKQRVYAKPPQLPPPCPWYQSLQVP